MATLKELLDPATFAAIQDYKLLARTIVEGFLSGLHRGLNHGQGSEFFQYRSYTPGDDVKFVDWKVYARRNQLYTKTFEEETNTSCYLVLDTSASMDYQGDKSPCNKFHYARMTIAALAYLAHRQGDSVGFAAYSEGIQEWLSPKQGSRHLDSVLQALIRLKAKGKTEHAPAWEALKGQLPGRGIIIFVSDMLEAEDTLPSLLRFANSQRFDCLAIQVLDPDEKDLPSSASLRFEDAETGRRISAFPDAIRQNFQESTEDFLSRLRRNMLASGVAFSSLTTETPLGYALGRYLHHRQKLS